MILAPFNQNSQRHVSSTVKGNNFKQSGRLLRKECEQKRKQRESWELDHHEYISQHIKVFGFEFIQHGKVESTGPQATFYHNSWYSIIYCLLSIVFYISSLGKMIDVPLTVHTHTHTHTHSLTHTHTHSLTHTHTHTHTHTLTLTHTHTYTHTLHTTRTFHI